MCNVLYLWFRSDSNTKWYITLLCTRLTSIMVLIVFQKNLFQFYFWGIISVWKVLIKKIKWVKLSIKSKVKTSTKNQGKFDRFLREKKKKLQLLNYQITLLWYANQDTNRTSVLLRPTDSENDTHGLCLFKLTRYFTQITTCASKLSAILTESGIFISWQYPYPPLILGAVKERDLLNKNMLSETANSRP